MFFRIILFSAIVFTCSSLFSKDMKVKRVGGVDLVLIESGEFYRGYGKKSDFSPRRKISITKGFWIGKYEITQSLYKEVTGKEPTKRSKYGNGSDLPVYSISWYDAIEFCNLLSIKNGLKPAYLIHKNEKDRNNVFPYDKYKWKIKLMDNSNGFRLPTEAQWEYASRAGTSGKYYWGNSGSWSVSGRYSWHMFNTGRKRYKGKRFWWVKFHKVRPVGKKSPNNWGLYDMLGNVSEWCWDSYGKDYYSKGYSVNPRGHEGEYNYRVLRGGSFLDSPADLTVYKRWPISPCERRATNGLRVVLPEKK